MNRSARKLALILAVALLGGGAACGGGGGSKDAIKVGAIFDLSGPTADIGTPYAEGIKDYIAYRNDKGGIDGHKMDLIAGGPDFGYDAGKAAQLYQQAVDAGAQVFMGWGTADTEALIPKVNKDQIPFMSASNSEVLAFPKETPYNFFPGASYSQQMRIALQYISDHNQGKHAEVAFFHNDSAFGRSPLEDGKKYIADKKLDIGFTPYAMPKGATDYIAQIGQAKAQFKTNPGYVVIQNVPSPAAVLAKNLAAEKSTAQIICLNYCAGEIYVTKAGEAANGTIGVVPFAPPVAGLPGLEEINTYLKTKNSSAEAKGVGYVQGWYTMAAMSKGIENAYDAKGKKIDGPAIKAGLEKISDFQTGVSDPISFSADYHAGLKSAPLYQIEGGKFKKIADPIKIAT